MTGHSIRKLCYCMGDFIHGNKVTNIVVNYKVSLLTRRDLIDSISAQRQ